MNRREFIAASAITGSTFAFPQASRTVESDLTPIWKEIDRRHAVSVQQLQQWIRQPSIAAENRGMNEGCDLTMRMLREAGFDPVKKIPTAGHPGIFATLDAGAARTLAVYFMYDVKQVDPAEWSSPPFEAVLLDRPGFGKILMGRGAVNQKARRHLSSLRCMPSAAPDPEFL